MFGALMPRLNYHHLYYFWQVARDGNLTRVATRLHVSQSALSTQIRQLEERLGHALFERQGRSLQLTRQGQRVLNYANDIFQRGEELERLVFEAEEPSSQTLRIGVLSTLSRNFVDGFIEPMLERQGVRFSLHARGLTNLINGLSEQYLDLILTNTEVGGGDEGSLWHCQLLARQPVSVIGPAEFRGRDLPKGYQDCEWVLPGSRTAIRGAFDAWCALVRFSPKIKAEADDMAMLRLLARDSGALAVLPPVVVQDELQQGRLAELHVLPNLYEHFYAVTVKGARQPALLTELVQKASQTDKLPGTV